MSTCDQIDDKFKSMFQFDTRIEKNPERPSTRQPEKRCQDLHGGFCGRRDNIDAVVKMFENCHKYVMAKQITKRFSCAKSHRRTDFTVKLYVLGFLALCSHRLRGSRCVIRCVCMHMWPTIQPLLKTPSNFEA